MSIAKTRREILAVMNHAESEGHAHTAQEIAATLPIFKAVQIRSGLKALEKAGKVFSFKAKGKIHWRPVVSNPSPGEMMHGEHASADQRKAAAVAVRKASAFYGNPKLLTEAKALRGFKVPESFVEIGEWEALEYISNKFDGHERIYRHDVTKKRKFLLSTDGSTIIVQPPFKVTKRGIEG